MNTYVLRYPDGRYVALDEMSGGYPYPTTDLNQVKFWSTAEEADKYRQGGDNRHGFTLEKIVEIVTEVVRTRTVKRTEFVDP